MEGGEEEFINIMKYIWDFVLWKLFSPFQMIPVSSYTCTSFWENSFTPHATGSFNLVQSPHAITSELNELVKYFILVNENEWTNLNEGSILPIARTQRPLVSFAVLIDMI